MALMKFLPLFLSLLAFLLCFSPARAFPVAVNGVLLPSENITNTVTLSNDTAVISGPSEYEHGLAIGDGSFPLFHIEAKIVILGNISLRNGFSDGFGGCILVTGVVQLSLTNVELMGCHAIRGGGGIYAFPSGDLQLIVKYSLFQDISVVHKANQTSVTEDIGGFVAFGAVLGASFLGTSTNKTTISIVSTSIIDYNIMIQTNERFVGRGGGGAFSFYFPHNDSGWFTEVEVVDVTFQDGLLSLTSSFCDTYLCPHTSFGIWFAFGGESSGSQLAMTISGLTLDNIAFDNTPYWLATGFGAVFWGENSGHNVALKASGISLADSQIEALTFVVGAWWRASSSGRNALAQLGSTTVISSSILSFSAVLGLQWIFPESGDNSTALITSQMMVSDSLLGVSSSMVVMSWFASSSGNGSALTFAFASISFVNCTTLYNANFFWMNWAGTSSGFDSVLSINDDSSLLFNSVQFSNDVSVAMMSWQEENCGSRSRVVVKSSSLLFLQNAFHDNVAIVWLQWKGNFSGSEAAVSIEARSVIALQYVTFGSPALLITMYWYEKESGGSSAITISNSVIFLSMCSIGEDSSLIWMQWQNRESGNNAALSISQTQITFIGCSFRFESGLSAMMWNDDFSGFNSTLAFTNSSLTVHQCVFFQKVAMFWMVWIGAQTGHNSSMILQSSRVFLQSTSTAEDCSIAVMLWGANFSGDVSAMNIEQVSLVIQNATFGANSVLFWMEWGGLASGSDSLLFVGDDTVIDMSNTILTSVCSFFNMLFYESHTGNNSALVVSSISAKLTYSAIGYNSILFWMDWRGPSGGTNSRLSFEKQSSIMLNNVMLNEAAGIASMLWDTLDIGVDGLFGCEGRTTIIFDEVTMLQYSFIFSMEWFVRGKNAQFLIGDCVFEGNNVVSSESTPFLLLDQPGNGLTARGPKRFTCYSCVASEGLFVFSKSGVTEFNLSWTSRIELTDSSIASIISVVAPILMGSIVVKNVHLSYSNADILSFQMPLREGSFPLPFLPTIVDISSVEVSNSSVTVIHLNAPELSTPLFLQLKLHDVSAIHNEFVGASLSAPDSGSGIEANFSGIVVYNASTQFLTVEGFSGKVDITNSQVNGIVNGVFAKMTLYETMATLNVTIASLHLANIMVLQFSSVFSCEGAVNLLFLEDCELGLGSVASTANPLLDFRMAAGQPSLGSPSETNSSSLSINVGIAMLSSSRIPFTLISMPAGSTSIDNYFLSITFSAESQLQQVSYRVPQYLSCPVGYAFFMMVQVSSTFSLSLTQPPYNCLSPFDSEWATCNAPTYSATATCVPCSKEGTISFLRGSVENAVILENTPKSFLMSSTNFSRCQPCPPTMRCEGGAGDASLIPSHWTLPLPLLWSVPWSPDISSLGDAVRECRPGACSPAQPLTYVHGEQVEGTSACTAGRDEASPLCARCEANTSAAFFTSACVENCSFGVPQFLFLAVLLLFFGGYVVFLTFRPVTPQSPWLRIVAYYYSVLSLLFENQSSNARDVLVQLSSALATLSSTSSAVAGRLAVCFSGLQPVHILGLKFFFPIIVMFVFVATSLCRRGQKNGARFLSGLFSIMLLSYSSITGAVFAFAVCTDVAVIEEETLVLRRRLLADAASPCWTSVPWIGVLLVFGLLLVFGIPIALFVWQGLFPAKGRPFYRLQRTCFRRRFVPANSRLSSKTWKGVTVLFVLEGNLSLWFWDVVLFVRRAVLEIVAVFAPRGPIMQSLFLLLNVINLSFHAIARPYRSTFANITETAILAILVLLSGLGLASSSANAVGLVGNLLDTFQSTVSEIKSWVAFAGLLIAIVPPAIVYGRRIFLMVRKRWNGARRRSTSRHSSMELEDSLLKNSDTTETESRFQSP